MGDNYEKRKRLKELSHREDPESGREFREILRRLFPQEEPDKCKERYSEYSQSAQGYLRFAAQVGMLYVDEVPDDFFKEETMWIARDSINDENEAVADAAAAVVMKHCSEEKVGKGSWRDATDGVYKSIWEGKRSEDMDYESPGEQLGDYMYGF